MKTKQTNRLHWTARRDIALGICLVTLVLAAALGLRAVDTGSLGQYSLTLILGAVAANRFYVAVRRKKP